MMGSKMKWWFGVCLAGILFIFLYIPTFSVLVKVWWGTDTYSHGFLIIPIGLYLVWTTYPNWRTKQPAPNLIYGIFVLAFSMGMLLLGRFGNILTLAALSFITTIAGIVLLMLGASFLSAWRFPIAYLLFMIPIDRLLLQNIHWPLQMFSAQMGTSLLNLFGFPAFLEHQFIQLPNMTLEVAKACSGLNYLTSIIAVGMPLAYLSIKRVALQIGLVLSSVIIAILANGVRVALAGVMVSLGHSIHGPSHLLEGVVIAWIGFIALFLGAWFLARIESTQPLHAPTIPLPEAPIGTKGLLDTDRFNRGLALMVVLFVLMGWILFVGSPIKIPWKENAQDHFVSMEGWHKEPYWDESFPVRMETADKEEMASYKDTTGFEAQLYSGYFERQSPEKELIDITTARLHEGAEVIMIPINQTQSIRVNKGIYPRNNGTYLILFWYNIDGRVVSSWVDVKRLTLWNALMNRTSNGSIFVLSVPLSVPLDPKYPITELLEKQMKVVRLLVSAQKIRSPS